MKHVWVRVLKSTETNSRSRRGAAAESAAASARSKMLPK